MCTKILKTKGVFDLAFQNQKSFWEKKKKQKMFDKLILEATFEVFI